MDRLWRTAKDELALVVGCAASAGYTQQGDEPEQPCENLSFHFAPHLTPPSRAPRLQNQLAVPPLEWLMESRQDIFRPPSSRLWCQTSTAKLSGAAAQGREFPATTLQTLLVAAPVLPNSPYPATSRVCKVVAGNSRSEEHTSELQSPC